MPWKKEKKHWHIFRWQYLRFSHLSRLLEWPRHTSWHPNLSNYFFPWINYEIGLKIMITKLVAPWLGWQDRRPPAARGWPHLCPPPTRCEASHPPRSTLPFANLASEWQPRLDFANIIFVFPLYLQAILHLVNLRLRVNQSWIFKCCLCICDVFVLHCIC